MLTGPYFDDNQSPLAKTLTATARPPGMFKSAQKFNPLHDYEVDLSPAKPHHQGPQDPYRTTSKTDQFRERKKLNDAHRSASDNVLILSQRVSPSHDMLSTQKIPISKAFLVERQTKATPIA